MLEVRVEVTCVGVVTGREKEGNSEILVTLFLGFYLCECVHFIKIYPSVHLGSVHNFNVSYVKNCDGSEICPRCKPATVSWMLAGDLISLGQRQRN